MSVIDFPALDVWVTDHCVSCARTLNILSACKDLHALVSVHVHRLGGSGESPPPAVVGSPAIVFRGAVIALGTPDCSELSGRIMSLLGVQAEVGGDR